MTPKDTDMAAHLSPRATRMFATPARWLILLTIANAILPGKPTVSVDEEEIAAQE